MNKFIRELNVLGVEKYLTKNDNQIDRAELILTFAKISSEILGLRILPLAIKIEFTIKLAILIHTISSMTDKIKVEAAEEFGATVIKTLNLALKLKII